jgi:hypothetical protein
MLGDESVKITKRVHSGNAAVCCVDFGAGIRYYTVITLWMSNVAESPNFVFEPNLRDWVQKFLEENTVVQRQ